MKYKVALVLVSLLLLTVPVSANITCPWSCDQYSGLGWNDTFTLDSRTAYYTSQTAGFSVVGGELQSTTNSNQMFRNDKTLANGSFIWNLSSTGPNAEENSPGCIFGSLSGTDAWGWWDSGNKYVVAPAFQVNYISLNKIVAGATTWITGNSVNLNPDVWYNITAEWYPQGATKIRVWVNGTQMFTSNDATFTTTGYAGIGTWWQNTATMEWTEFFFTYSPAPLSNFTSTTHECTGTCSLTFTDDSSRATVVDRNWTINGSIATGGGGNPQSITLTPPIAGSITYTICLNTTASPYTDIDQALYGWNLSTTCWPVVVSSSVIAPVAAFSCTPLTGCNQTDVTCTDASTNTPLSWLWSIENQSEAHPDHALTSTVKNPIFNITWGDTYNVNLSATNAGGTDWENKTGYITINYCPSVVIPWAPCSPNENITISKGETWIEWNWTRATNISGFIINEQDLYVNGSLWQHNYPHNYLILTGVGSNSYQVIEVWGLNSTYNNRTQCLYSAVRSDPSAVWWPFIIGMVLLCIGYFVPLFGFLAIILLLFGFYMVYQEYTQSYIVLAYGLSAIIAMIVTAFRIGRKK